MTLPNFFLIGAPKAGTTSLFRYLGQHPGVYMSPVKEPCFFAPEVAGADPGVTPTGLVLDRGEYERLFDAASTEIAIGEASVAYLASTTAAGNIHADIPTAKILVMLRDPGERLFAHYTAAVAAGVTSAPFVEWVDRQVDIERSRPLPFGPIQAGRYAQNLTRYVELFPAAQIHVELFERFAGDPSGSLAETFAFLGVDARHPIDVTRRHNVTVVPRWPGVSRAVRPLAAAARALAPALVDRVRGFTHAPFALRPTRADRARALDLYAGDLRALTGLIPHDVSRWLDA